MVARHRGCRVRPPGRALLLMGLLSAGCGGAEQKPAEVAPSSSDDIAAGYVGSETCMGCHAEIYESFRASKMGQSITDFDRATATEDFEGTESVYSELYDLHYEAYVDDGELVQREWRVNEEGEVVHDLALSADLVIGSGNQTRSYLMVRNGRVTQMPLTWYPHGGRWDLSPGYHEANDRFSRKMNLDCLMCHGDRARRSPGTQNHYEELPGAISCERCHGPGEDHVAAWSGRSEDVDPRDDPLIVNPVDLGRDRQLSVCMQCHLSGVRSYVPGEGPGTFEPGMHLAENRTVYVPEIELTDPEWIGITSHPVRLARSACFQESEMTCTTCHAPHPPDGELPPYHFNQQCLSCHMDREHEVGQPGACGRKDLGPGDDPLSGDCVSCHMPSGGATDVPHIQATDHWIRRDPGPALSPDDARPVIEEVEPLRLQALSPRGEKASPELHRHLTESERLGGLTEALFHFYETMHRLPDYIPQVIEVGRRSLEEGAGTVEGRIALGRALVDQGELEEAEEVYRGALEGEPDNSWVHFLLGSALEERMGRPDEGIEHLRRAVEIQPEFQEARIKLGEALYGAGRPVEAEAELEEVVRRDPIHEPRSWFNLAILRAELGDRTGALHAFREASRLDPDAVQAHIHLGSMELEDGRVAEAEEAFRAALAADPDAPSAHGSMAFVHIERGEWVQARSRLERVLALDPGNQQARVLLDQLPGGR